MAHIYPPLVVMGVSGSGKSTIGRLLGERLEMEFIDGDDLHPAENKKKMRNGQALNDDDRRPWLEKIGERIAADAADGNSIIVACSALKHVYRDIIRTHAPQTVFVHLAGDPDVIRDRIDARSHEYMPSSLLESQLATLEQLGDDEHSIEVDIARGPELIVGTVVDALDAR